MEHLIQQSLLWRTQEQLYRSMKGIGPVMARTLIAELPELGTTDNKRISALVGLVPLNRDRGTLRGKRIIWGG